MTRDDHACALLIFLAASLAGNVVLGVRLVEARHKAMMEAAP